ncbi:MAG: YSC84-related protein, partial [Candidatus Tectomicrobia bacterium]|nr:YSC84-related protein [Candidatus Tectomicrobia bacterium]
TKGLFGGLSVEGSVIGPRHKWNRAYYGKEVRPIDILIRRDVNNTHAVALVSAVTKAARAAK